MTKVPIRIKRAVREGNYIINKHCTDALADEGFNLADAIAAVLGAQECTKYTRRRIARSMGDLRIREGRQGSRYCGDNAPGNGYI